MLPSTGDCVRAAWLAFGAYWVVTARRVKAAERTEPVATRVLVYWLPLLLGLVLLGGHDDGAFGVLDGRFVPRGTVLEPAGAALCLAGAALAIWARHLLGANWSSTVQLKRDHELIQRGPYRVVRHPIYSGLLLLFLGNALEVGAWRGLLAVAIVFASFWRKLRLEERWLGEHFGEPYRDYQARTKALVPGLL